MDIPPFRFKRFRIEQQGVAHPVGTDGVLLGAWADVRDAHRILDIGTGTGVVALLLAQRTEHLSDVAITGVEVHPASFSCARHNFRQSPWAQRLFAVQSSVQEFARQTTSVYDLIVSNPPFFSETVLSPDADRRLVRNSHALPPGELLDAVTRLLAENGTFCVILPVTEGRRLCERAALRRLYCTKETAVFTRIGKPCERLLLQFERSPYPFSRSQLVIYERDTTYSNDFKALTAAFYLD